MENVTEKIKRLRKEVIRTFFLLFTPHIFVCLLTTQVTANPMNPLKWQLCWFITYFSISILVYVLAPNIVKRQNTKLKK